jgi:hypothetical protein
LRESYTRIRTSQLLRSNLFPILGQRSILRRKAPPDSRAVRVLCHSNVFIAFIQYN